MHEGRIGKSGEKPEKRVGPPDPLKGEWEVLGYENKDVKLENEQY